MVLIVFQARFSALLVSLKLSDDLTVVTDRALVQTVAPRGLCVAELVDALLANVFLRPSGLPSQFFAFKMIIVASSLERLQLSIQVALVRLCLFRLE